MTDTPVGAENQDEIKMGVNISGVSIPDDVKARVEQALIEAVDRELASPDLTRSRGNVFFSRTIRR